MLISAPIKILTFKPVILAIIFLSIVGGVLYYFQINLNQISNLKSDLLSITGQKSKIEKTLQDVQKELDELKNQDQLKVNNELKDKIKKIEKTYKGSVKAFEKMQELNSDDKKADQLNKLLALSLNQLSEQNYASAEGTLSNLNKLIDEEKAKQAAAIATASAPKANLANVPSNNSAPGSGFSQQKVSIDSGEFLVSIIAADLSSTKVIVDTASDSDCRDNCPVLSLGDYVSRNGAFAGINGSFFCPSTYPSCAGKTNSFDTLIMNKNKHYFNSDNNVYSVVPAAIFSSGNARFVGQTLEWGRDTGVDAVIANYPLYVVGGNVNFSGNGDPKIDGKGTRTFIGASSGKAYMGIVYNATGSEAAKVLKTLGLRDALGMDQGGSTALWYGGYKAGPGRGIPNAVLFVKR